MKVLITGCKGQLGWEMERSRPGDMDSSGVDLPEVDLTRPGEAWAVIEETRPDVVVHAAAYTAVDRAEEERDAAFAVNGRAAGEVAAAAREWGARLIHVSTDFVFDGTKGSPYLVDDAPAPLGVYGASKLEGERRVMAEYPNALIFRTAWLYSAHGGNFVKTMLRLFGERDQIRVVADQTGTPTWAAHLADCLWRAARKPGLPAGIYHFTDAGLASWYDFAVAVEEESRTRRGREVAVTPIRTADYPTPARRPAYSVLDKTATWEKVGAPPVHWREALRRMLAEYYADGDQAS